MNLRFSNNYARYYCLQRNCDFYFKFFPFFVECRCTIPLTFPLCTKISAKLKRIKLVWCVFSLKKFHSIFWRERKKLFHYYSQSYEFLTFYSFEKRGLHSIIRHVLYEHPITSEQYHIAIRIYSFESCFHIEPLSAVDDTLFESQLFSLWQRMCWYCCFVHFSFAALIFIVAALI